jgi:SEC-C motif
MNRTPPKHVLEILRKEVGFGCPVEGCGNPYLEWHHFDPPWREKEHHDPDGMIALCTTHHPMADGGAYTKNQLRNLKNNKVESQKIKGQFHWLRNNILAVVGGVYFYETYKILVIDSKDIIWFNRDEDGYLRLNVRMLSILPKERAVIEDNMWVNIGDAADIKSPPQGKELEIRYENGDYLYVKFFELESVEQAFKKYGAASLLDINYPITAVEINYKIGGTRIEFTPNGTSIAGAFLSAGMMMSHVTRGLVVDVALPNRENPSRLPFKPTMRVSACPCGSGMRYKHCHGLLV